MSILIGRLTLANSTAASTVCCTANSSRLVTSRRAPHVPAARSMKLVISLRFGSPGLIVVETVRRMPMRNTRLSESATSVASTSGEVTSGCAHEGTPVNACG
jgi:hypothetical protein